MPCVAASSCSLMGPFKGSNLQPSSSTRDAALYWPMPAHSVSCGVSGYPCPCHLFFTVQHQIRRPILAHACAQCQLWCEWIPMPMSPLLYRPAPETPPCTGSCLRKVSAVV